MKEKRFSISFSLTTRRRDLQFVICDCSLRFSLALLMQICNECKHTHTLIHAYTQTHIYIHTYTLETYLINGCNGSRNFYFLARAYVKLFKYCLRPFAAYHKQTLENQEREREGKREKQREKERAYTPPNCIELSESER